METPEQNIAGQEDIGEARGRGGRYMRLFVWFLLFQLLLLLGVWIAREHIADRLIANELAGLNLTMTYDVEEITPERQVLTNIVVGDPQKPDLTIERAAVTLRYRWLWPALGPVTVEKPRLFGSFRENGLSFGSLDPLLFDPESPSQGLPQVDVRLVDGRALIETDYGPIGIKADGHGYLDDGFTARLGAIAPNPILPGCRVKKTTAYGDLRIAEGDFLFEGPVRARGLNCDGADVALASVDYQLKLEIDGQFERIEGLGIIEAGQLGSERFALGGAQGDFGFAWTPERFDTLYNINAARLSLAGHQIGQARIEGRARMLGGFEQAEASADIHGQDINLATLARGPLANLRGGTEGTLLDPLLARLGGALEREARNTNVRASATLRRTGDLVTLVVPDLAVRSRRGDPLLSASHIRASQLPSGAFRLAGNFRTNGRDIPLMRGRMERSHRGDSRLRLAMAPYGAADASLAIPEAVVVQSAGGAVGFAGQIAASGPLPGGYTRDLVLPVSGNWSSGGGLAIWRSCVPVRFRELSVANLALKGTSMTLCPPSSGAILRNGPGGFKLAAGTPALNLAGSFADTPIRVQSGPVGFAFPGFAKVNNLDLVLGEVSGATSGATPQGNRFTVSDLAGSIGGGRSGEEAEGSFSNADISISAVPLDLKEASGKWAFKAGQLFIDDAVLHVVDREVQARFEPLIAREASLRMVNSQIEAQAALRNPASDRIISTVDISHDLGRASGFADLNVDHLQFDEAMQPEQLSELALGVVANVEGLVEGNGRIDWSPQEISSTGTFSSDSLNLAAVFGPVEGLSGTIKFDDLLGLSTARGQHVHIKSINPGIEVEEGDVAFSLREGRFLAVNGGRWPFMGGTLRLKPVKLDLQAEENRRYVFAIDGANAAQFIEEYEITNLSVTGDFDGVMPITFDNQGYGAIEGGILRSREKGGNLSYLGELAYEDMGAIANFAFAALRSLDYEKMMIEVDGPLTGDIDTRMRIDGVRQADGARSNFITRKIAELPIRFNVNVKAPFYQMIMSLRSLYDPDSVRDPRDLKLVDGQGEAVSLNSGATADTSAIEPSVHSSESETMP